MHKSHYRPKRSQQLYLVEKLKAVYGWEADIVIVHHVLEDTPTKLLLQIERRWRRMGEIRIVFNRVEL